MMDRHKQFEKIKALEQIDEVESFLRAILSPLLTHMKSTAESNIAIVILTPDLSILVQSKELSMKFSMHGRVFFTGVLK